MNRQPPEAHLTVGDLIRRYREIAGLSQEALAERAGLSPRGLLYLERGMRRPYPATLRRLADALSLSPQEREALALASRHGGEAAPDATSTASKAPVDGPVAESAAPFGALLRQYRLAAGVTQEELAERTGLSVQGLSALENGRRPIPYRHTVTLLARAMGLSDAKTAALEAAVIRVRAAASGSPEEASAAAGGVAVDVFPPSPPPQLTRTNLPASLSSFIGREQTQAAVHDLLTNHRLVTLVGTGGVGKTRLALAVAEGLLDRYPDGVWLVELAALGDARLVPGTVAQTLGLREEPGRSAMETLSDHCRGRSMALLLDNCEHLLAGCTALAGALLRAAPELRILATSREALGVSGERRYQVPPLSVPDPEHPPAPELASSYEAVRLFVARAQERRDTFALTSANARAVVEVCARLDGLPLAIELAAARVAAMSVEMIAAHLHDRFRLLTTGSEDLPTRQRTLRATLDWSWELLGTRERALLVRFSVFAGGWTLEAATAVCADQETDYWAVVDGLDGLVNRSLAHMDEAPDGAVRYRLLESVRQHAAEQLAATGQEAATRDSHLAYFLALAEQAVQAFRGAAMGSWMDRLEQEHDNLRAALNWAHARAKGEAGLQLAAALAPFWEFHGHIAEGRRRLEEMLTTGAGSPSARARALNAAGFLAVRAGDHGAALPLYQESVALRRALGDAQGIAVALNNIGNVYIEMGEYARSEPAYAEALEFYRAAGDDWGVASVLNNQAVAARELGQYERAEALAMESLVLRRTQNDPRGVAEATNNLAQVASAQGQYTRAAALFKEGLRLSRDVGDMLRVIEAVEGLAWTAAALGQQRAARLGGAAEAEREKLGLPQGTPDRAFRDRAMQTMRAALGEQMLTAAWAEGRGMTLTEAIALALKDDSAGSTAPHE